MTLLSGTVSMIFTGADRDTFARDAAYHFSLVCGGAQMELGTGLWVDDSMVLVEDPYVRVSSTFVIRDTYVVGEVVRQMVENFLARSGEDAIWFSVNGVAQVVDAADCIDTSVFGY